MYNFLECRSFILKIILQSAILKQCMVELKLLRMNEKVKVKLIAGSLEPAYSLNFIELECPEDLGKGWK